MAKTQRIVLDTNFLLIPGQFGVDIFSELDRILDFPYQLFVLESSLQELERIYKKVSGKDRTAIKMAQQLIKTKNINIISQKQGSVDNILVELSKEPDTIIATLDHALRNRLDKAILLRQKKYLKLEM